MELTYLKELYRNGLFEVYDGFDTWQDAVSAACTPLIQQGLVEPAYADSIVENVAENGPYILLLLTSVCPTPNAPISCIRRR